MGPCAATREAYDVGMTALGVSLLIVGAIMILAEAHVPTLGVLGGPGVVVLAVGAVLAVLGLGGGIALGAVSALLLAGAGAGVVGVTVHKGMAVRRRRVRAGPEGLLGHMGVVRRWEGRTGSVLVDGALWRARRSMLFDDGEEGGVLHPGDEIVVESLDGLTVFVRKAEEWELIR
jgi:membrane-bound ClpP family serine protease